MKNRHGTEGPCPECEAIGVELGAVPRGVKSAAEIIRDYAEQRALMAKGEAATADIIEAVMLERQRCAKVAREAIMGFSGSATGAVADHVAARILSGE